MAKPSYHHGALREALMDACLELIDTDGIGAVSLRKVARSAGVSAAAPYHHFADRAALLAALAVRGFGILTAQLSAAYAGAATSQSPLIAITAAYVRFAGENPAYFRLMFRPELSQPEKHPDVHRAGQAAFAVLQQATDDAVQAGEVRADAAGTYAVAWWSYGHGVASLWVDGQLARRAAEFGSTPAELADGILSLPLPDAAASQPKG